MNASIRQAAAPSHRLKLDDVRPAMAKAELANVTNHDNRDFRSGIGAALMRMRMLCGCTADQIAREIDRDPAQVSRWERGIERPHIDAYMAVERFRFPMLIALAELLDAEVRTEITARRTA